MLLKNSMMPDGDQPQQKQSRIHNYGGDIAEKRLCEGSWGVVAVDSLSMQSVLRITTESMYGAMAHILTSSCTTSM